MDAASIQSLIEAIPDPEIPALTLGDLGIIRYVGWQQEAGSRLKIHVTPTYSGCPATSVIRILIEEALDQAGLTDYDLKQVISPPWTTDWMTEAGRTKLEASGIAPPHPQGRGVPVACPICHAIDLEQISEFGATPCQALWRCRSCLEPFNYFKCHSGHTI